MELRGKVNESIKQLSDKATQTVNKKPIQLESMCQTQPL